MPELPEVEIWARRLGTTLEGAKVESALAPGVVTMKTFDPPLSSLAGHTITGTARHGKMLELDFSGDLALLVHLMQAGACASSTSAHRCATRARESCCG